MLRFATGVLKGKLLSYSGPYKVIKWRGEEVALFRGGSMARFYDDHVPEPTPEQVETAAATIPEEVDDQSGEIISAPPTAFHPIHPPIRNEEQNFVTRIKRWLKTPIF